MWVVTSRKDCVPYICVIRAALIRVWLNYKIVCVGVKSGFSEDSKRSSRWMILGAPGKALWMKHRQDSARTAAAPPELRRFKIEGPKRLPEGGEWEPIKTFFRENLTYDPKRAPQALSSRVCTV